MQNVMAAELGGRAQRAQDVSAAPGRHQMPLSFLKSGEVATVAKVRGKGEVHHHLENLGFVEGARVEVWQPDSADQGRAGCAQPAGRLAHRHLLGSARARAEAPSGAPAQTALDSPAPLVQGAEAPRSAVVYAPASTMSAPLAQGAEAPRTTRKGKGQGHGRGCSRQDAA